MHRFSRLLHFVLPTVFLLSIAGSAPAAKNDEARVTQIVRDVKLLPAQQEARPAVLNDQVREGIPVRTGDKSRSELTFNDLTISRLGANTIFSFDNAGRAVQLDGGSVLVRVPKNSGGGNVRTNAVSVAITGTTLILESMRAGRNKLIVLEGTARLALTKYRGQSRDVRGGQMLDVPAGATTLPMPQNINVNDVMKSHPLIVGFPPLPSRDLIAEVGRRPPPADPGNQPVYPGGPPVVTGGFPFPTVGLPPIFPGTNNPTRPPSRPNPTNQPPGTSKPGGGTTSGTGGVRSPGQVPFPGSSGSTVGSTQPSSGGSTGPIVKRPPPTRKVPAPKSTPSPIR